MVESLPVIDMSPLWGREPQARALVGEAVARACEAHGFFYLTGHRIAPELIAQLEAASRRFFALPEAEKEAIAMRHGGHAWRGHFPVGGELTSGRPDLKEGLYLGTETAPDDPRARLPMHGPNLWPAAVPELRPAVLDYMVAATRAAAGLMQGISLSLGLDDGYFERTYTARPTVLFRVFRYPAAPAADPGWGVGEHTDYGLLTLLAQDRFGGLQVKGPGGWIEAPPVEGALVCNIGDMLERLTRGRFRSTPHRVRNTSGRDRLSFPLFFDPDFEAPMRPLPPEAVGVTRAAASDRWDRADPHAFEGTYGDYLMDKVARVFPELFGQVVEGAS